MNFSSAMHRIHLTFSCNGPTPRENSRALEVEIDISDILVLNTINIAQSFGN